MTVNKYNNTYSTIKMKPVDLKPSIYIDFNKKNKVGDNVRISKYKNIFAYIMLQICLKKFLWLQKFKILCGGHYVISDLNRKNIVGTFCKKESQKTNQEEFRVEKVIKRKGNKLFTQWKGYDNSFNNWTDKKGII